MTLAEGTPIRFIVAALVAVFVVSGPAFAHHEPAKVRYFAHRCADSPSSAVLACVHRATIQFHVDYGQARYIATRESGLHPELCNGEVPGGPQVPNRLSRACGLVQFMPGTWAGTPYAAHSRFSAKWASLAYGWMVKHGHASAWKCC